MSPVPRSLSLLCLIVRCKIDFELQEAGVQLGDILEQLDGMHLGSFQEAIERLKQRRGTVVLTLLRQKD